MLSDLFSCGVQSVENKARHIPQHKSFSMFGRIIPYDVCFYLGQICVITAILVRG